MNQETSGANPQPRRHKGLRIALAVALLFCAFFARLPGASSDLTLDEILSLNEVKSISSPAEIFTRLHADNNHYLNSLWLWFAGDKNGPLGCRLPSLAEGIGIVVMAWLIGRRRDPATAWIAMFLTAFSYVLVLYSGQARGYSGLVFFAYLSFYLLDIYLSGGPPKFAAWFGLATIMGFLSHVNFITFLAVSLPWAAWRLRKSSGFARKLLFCYAAPSLFFLALYLVNIRHMFMLGGTTTTLFNAFAASLAWIIPPPAQKFTMAMSILSVAGIAAAAWRIRREQSGSLFFFAGVIFVFPVLLVVVRGVTVLYARYFILGIAFALLLMASALSALYSSGRRGRVACIALLALYALVNARCILLLFLTGQGNYSGAILTMADQTSPRATTIGAARDFGVQTILGYYAPQLPPGMKAIFYQGGSWPKAGVDWVVFEKESYEDPVPPGPSLSDPAGNTYLFFKVIPSAPLAGQHWFLYRNPKTISGDIR